MSKQIMHKKSSNNLQMCFEKKYKIEDCKTKELFATCFYQSFSFAVMPNVYR